MDNLKQIMYGVTDFARMRKENAYFVDRTGLIRELEKTSYACCPAEKKVEKRGEGNWTRRR